MFQIILHIGYVRLLVRLHIHNAEQILRLVCLRFIEVHFCKPDAVTEIGFHTIPLVHNQDIRNGEGAPPIEGMTGGVELDENILQIFCVQVAVKDFVVDGRIDLFLTGDLTCPVQGAKAQPAFIPIPVDLIDCYMHDIPPSCFRSALPADGQKPHAAVRDSIR